MGTVAALGERQEVEGFALAGVVVFAAEEPAQVHQAWKSLPADVEVVILTKQAAAVLGQDLDGDSSPMTAVLP